MPRSYPGYTFVKKKGGICEYRLIKNGLTILIEEDHSSPTATIMVTFNVGSRNEVTGITGSTHILEHMLFKGSKKFNKKTKYTIDSLEDFGARRNATTWFDRTNYYETLPIEHLPLAIEMEADRMRNAILRNEDLKTEMTVVRNEFERGENEPADLLSKEIWAAAFLAHPYHHDTIGWKSDIENTNIEKLKKFYDTFYWPNNATVTLIGDFETANVLSLVKKFFGQHSRSKDPIPQINIIEPKQYGERRVLVNRTDGLDLVSIAWKVPEALHTDMPALQVIASLLGDGKSSILHRTLVDHGFAINAYSQHYLTRDPGLFVAGATLAPGIEHHEVEQLIYTCVTKIEETTDAGLTKAKKLLEAEVAFGRDGSYAKASWINSAIAVGDWTLYPDFLKKIDAVTTKDCSRVAKKYFNQVEHVVGYYKNTNGKKE